MHHPVDVEIENTVQKLRGDELNARQHAEQDLREEQDRGDGEVLDRQPLTAIQMRAVESVERGDDTPRQGGDGMDHGCTCAFRVLKLCGNPLVSMADIHFRKAMTPRDSSSVNPGFGMTRPEP